VEEESGARALFSPVVPLVRRLVLARAQYRAGGETTRDDDRERRREGRWRLSRKFSTRTFSTPNFPTVAAVFSLNVFIVAFSECNELPLSVDGAR